MPETVTTHSREETQRLAADVAARLAGLPAGSSAVVTLRGDLGSGKTTFTQGMLSALGVQDRVTSPTFLLVNRYPLSGRFSNAYHIDAYRLAAADDFRALGIEQAVADPESLVLVEWPEVGGELLVPTLDARFEHAGDDARRITFSWHA